MSLYELTWARFSLKDHGSAISGGRQAVQHCRHESEYIYIYMDVSALLRLKQRASRMAPSEFSFTATSQLTDPTIYLCSGSKPCSESTPCKRTTLFMIFLPPSCFLSLLPPSCFLGHACSSPSRSFEIVLLAKTSKSEKIVAEIGREVADVGRPTNHGVASSGSHRQG